MWGKFRRMLKGEFNPADIFLIGGIIIFCFLMLWYAVGTFIPELKFW